MLAGITETNPEIRPALSAKTILGGFLIALLFLILADKLPYRTAKYRIVCRVGY